MKNVQRKQRPNSLANPCGSEIDVTQSAENSFLNRSCSRLDICLSDVQNIQKSLTPYVACPDTHAPVAASLVPIPSKERAYVFLVSGLHLIADTYTISLVFTIVRRCSQVQMLGPGNRILFL